MRLTSQSAPEYSAEVEERRLPATTEEEQRYEALCRTFLPRLVSYARRRAPYDDPDDAVQDALFDIWWRWSTIARAVEQNPERFFFTAVRQQLLKRNDQVTRDERFAPLLEGEGVGQWSKRAASTAALDLDRSALAAAIENSVEAMPKRPREAWLLVRENELTYQEAADVMEIAPVSMRQLIARAQHILREALMEAGYRLSTRIFPRRPSKGFILLPRSTGGAAND
jgi:RNA polymerase sigma factor (sigma-70 family)